VSKDQKVNVRAFRKYGFGGIGTFYTYVTQFPFRGHDPWVIEDTPANKHEVVKEMKACVAKDLREGPLAFKQTTPTADKSQATLYHADITDELIQQNSFVFGLNQAKMNDIQRANAGHDAWWQKDKVLRIPRGFDFFNKRTEFPYDTIENPMKLNPHADDQLQ